MTKSTYMTILKEVPYTSMLGKLEFGFYFFHKLVILFRLPFFAVFFGKVTYNLQIKHDHPYVKKTKLNVISDYENIGIIMRSDSSALLLSSYHSSRETGHFDCVATIKA